ncbi:carboxypeptidase-like regulatory domain-containing protein [Draconibacterium sp. IB214405]|uniref:carboxypeptidase-like regulatory domain-containing protein n=1 Tax=Draconibacterium sp. IB214405 TaxID=3097352 RepID=UPI002A0F925D|nr:carboxypeptidase-like regulatory domain-containing protein [Draconibacterium sp. IB214405]MDX8338740.1 carboxypeptidase-like regulatory domain-containing protein [Draconibacterium sp. IB214405]
MKRTALLSLLLLLLLACDKDEYPGVIRGNVWLTDNYKFVYLDSYDDNSGVKISLCDKNGTVTKTISDEDGNYEITNVKPGEFKLLFEKEGFSFYELFDINIEGADTIDLTYPQKEGGVICLQKLESFTFQTIKGPYIDSYKGSLPEGPYEGQFGLVYDIVTEIGASRDFMCMAYVSTEEDVDYMNYQMAIFCHNMHRKSIGNRILKFNFHDLDRELFPLNTTIYIRYYPYDGDPIIYDPWLNIDKYCTMHFDKSKLVSFTIPDDEMYFEGSPL